MLQSAKAQAAVPSTEVNELRQIRYKDMSDRQLKDYLEDMQEAGELSLLRGAYINSVRREKRLFEER